MRCVNREAAEARTAEILEAMQIAERAAGGAPTMGPAVVSAAYRPGFGDLAFSWHTYVSEGGVLKQMTRHHLPGQRSVRVSSSAEVAVPNCKSYAFEHRLSEVDLERIVTLSRRALVEASQPRSTIDDAATFMLSMPARADVAVPLEHLLHEDLPGTRATFAAFIELWLCLDALCPYKTPLGSLLPKEPHRP